MWKRLFKAGLVTLTLLLLGFGWFMWRAQAQLKTDLVDYRNAGHATELSDLKRIVPASDNAALPLYAISDDAQKLYDRIHPFAHAHADEFDWRVGLSEAQVTETAAGFDAFPQVLAAMETAVQCSDFAWPVNYDQPSDKLIEDLIEVSGVIRNFARISDCRARYLVSIGRSDEAAEVYLRQLHLCRLQEREPTLTMYLVNSACRAIPISYLGALMQARDLSESTHQRIETELAQHDAMPSFAHALETEVPLGWSLYRSYPFPGQLMSGFNDYLSFMQRQIEIGAEDHYRYAQRANPRMRGITATVEPAIDAAREVTNRIRAWGRALRILNAIHAQGLAPDSKVTLADLSLSQETTTDPFSGRPMIVKSTEDGWFVYSVGKNGKDDGGRVIDTTDIGFAPAKQ